MIQLLPWNEAEVVQSFPQSRSTREEVVPMSRSMDPEMIVRPWEASVTHVEVATSAPVVWRGARIVPSHDPYAARAARARLEASVAHMPSGIRDAVLASAGAFDVDVSEDDDLDGLLDG